MIRFLWIPVAGTVAALVAILLAHPPRGDAPAPFTDPRDSRPEFPGIDGPLPPPDEVPPPVEPPAPPAEAVYHVTLKADGTLEETGTEETFSGVDELLEALAPEGARPTVLLFNASGEVTREQLEAVADRLRARCKVRTSYRE